MIYSMWMPRWKGEINKKMSAVCVLEGLAEMWGLRVSGTLKVNHRGFFLIWAGVSGVSIEAIFFCYRPIV